MTERDDGLTRYTVTEAARILGVGTDAVRKRIQRDTIEHERADGTVYVWLDADEPRRDGGVTEDLVGAYKDQLDSYRDQVAFLRRELERKDAILLNMTETMKALSPPPREPRESDLTPSEERGGTETRLEPERRSWWRRLFP